MHVLKCTSCDLLIHVVPVARGFCARCPSCGSRVIKNSSISLSGELAIALAALVLFLPAQFYALVSIDLIGVPLSTTVTSGSVILLDTFPFVGALVIFCVAIAPLLYLLTIIISNISVSLRNARVLYYSSSMLKIIRHWVMVDVFLVSLAVGCFKVQDFAEISVDKGLLSFVLLQVLTAVLLARVSPKRYWNALGENQRQQEENEETSVTPDTLVGCSLCGLTQSAHHQHCTRCGKKLEHRKFQSIQKTWASLLAAVVFIFPANLYPISILLTNGKRLEDTIFSGVASLIKQGMYGIAIIIFTASIIVPVVKIICLAYILLCIHFKVESGRKLRMKLYRFVKWIGKWSMMDLCVIAIMVSLIDRGNLLDFTPGPGAIAFGLVVVLTMIAAESLDSRLIWDKYEQR